MKSSPDLLRNTERSSVTAFPSMSHCEDKMAAAEGPEQNTHSGYLSECCPHVTMPLRCHFWSWTGWNALTSHGPVSLKIHSLVSALKSTWFFSSSCITCAYSSDTLLSADKMTPSMKLINVISGNTACNPLCTASSVSLVDNKYNINSSALISCHHLSVMVWFYNAG